MQFCITKDRIARGVRNSPGSCPVAITVREELGILEVQANLHSILINGRLFPTPEKVRQFMSRYDDCKDKTKLQPMQFALPVEER